MTEQELIKLMVDPAFFWILLLLALWAIPWKGVALWKASKNNQKIWFIVLLVVNTVGILEIVYIFYFSKKKEKNLILI